MLYSRDKIEVSGGFVRPTTRAGRKLILRCLRARPFPHHIGNEPPSTCAGPAAPGMVPADVAMREFFDERIDSVRCIPFYTSGVEDCYGHRDWPEIFGLFRGGDGSSLAIAKDCRGNPDPRLLFSESSSRVLVRASWHWSQRFELEKAIDEQEERWRDAKEAAEAERERKRERNRILREAREARKERARLAERSRAVRVAVAFAGSNGNKIKQLRALGIVAG